MGISGADYCNIVDSMYIQYECNNSSIFPHSSTWRFRQQFHGMSEFTIVEPRDHFIVHLIQAKNKWTFNREEDTQMNVIINQ